MHLKLPTNKTIRSFLEKIDVGGSGRGNATREVEVRLFANDFFQLEYKENVINIETHRKVYVEFKGRKE